jgi:hypothetical protein
MQKFYGVEYELDSIWEFNLPILNPFDPKDTINFPNVVLATMPADWGGLVRLENSFNLKGEDAKAYALSLFSGSNNPEQKFADIFGSKPLAFEYYISYAIFPDTGVIDSMYLTMSYFSGEEIFLQKYVKLILN